MQIKLLSMFKLVDAKGREFNQSELVRWFSETAWFPTSLLASESVRWEPIDTTCAKVFLSDHNITVEGMFFFNEQGQTIRFRAIRYSNGRLQNWLCNYYDYREVEGMHIPFYAEASWNTENCDSKYAKLEIEQIEYDKPSQLIRSID